MSEPDLRSILYRMRDEIMELERQLAFETDEHALVRKFRELRQKADAAYAVALKVAEEQQGRFRPPRFQPPPPDGPCEHGNGGHEPSST